MSIQEKIALAHKRNDEFGQTPEGRALDNRMLVARNIIALLKSRKTTQSEFCAGIGMKLAQFNRIVMGDENITVFTATRIADGFGVHISRLYQKSRNRSEAAVAGK
jgi:transcriptional regulator with XRE-family HTH domain